MPHLPGAHAEEDYGLGQGPPENPLVGALGGLPEALLAVPLVVLLLGDLLNLIQKLAHSQLKLCQLLFLSNIGIINCVLANLDVKVDSELGA